MDIEGRRPTGLGPRLSALASRLLAGTLLLVTTACAPVVSRLPKVERPLGEALPASVAPDDRVLVLPVWRNDGVGGCSVHRPFFVEAGELAAHTRRTTRLSVGWWVGDGHGTSFSQVLEGSLLILEDGRTFWDKQPAVGDTPVLQRQELLAISREIDLRRPLKTLHEILRREGLSYCPSDDVQSLETSSAVRGRIVRFLQGSAQRSQGS